MEMNESQIIDNLNERIKELTCLYEISSLSSNQESSLTEKLNSICKVVAAAWRFSDKSVAEITALGTQYLSNPIPGKTIYQVEPIVVDNQEVGYVRVHYPANGFVESDFLIEEKQLIKKVAQEISVIIERHIHNQKEALLQRSVEHNDRLAILGEITAGIAHELNTPLGNILGFSELIADNTREDQVIRDAAKITNSAIYAREIVKKLMFFSCEMPQQIESTSINVIVSDALKLLKPSTQNAGVAVRFIPDERNILGRFDPVQITQVIFNLMINAIYVSPEGSEITIKITSNENTLTLEIADQGSGMTPEIGDKIFEPFFTTKPVGEGSGLGLSVVHGIIKSHGGSIHFSSEIDAGTTFHITLPLRL